MGFTHINQPYSANKYTNGGTKRHTSAHSPLILLLFEIDYCIMSPWAHIPPNQLHAQCSTLIAWSLVRVPAFVIQLWIYSMQVLSCKCGLYEQKGDSSILYNSKMQIPHLCSVCLFEIRSQWTKYAFIRWNAFWRWLCCLALPFAFAWGNNIISSA